MLPRTLLLVWVNGAWWWRLGGLLCLSCRLRPWLVVIVVSMGSFKVLLTLRSVSFLGPGFCIIILYMGSLSWPITCCVVCMDCILVGIITRIWL